MCKTKVDFLLKMQSISGDTVLHIARSNLSVIVLAYIKCDLNFGNAPLCFTITDKYVSIFTKYEFYIRKVGFSRQILSLLLAVVDRKGPIERWRFSRKNENLFYVVMNPNLSWSDDSSLRDSVNNEQFVPFDPTRYSNRRGRICPQIILHILRIQLHF
ncbi:unnamed protein product [Albugo candida]|uniref:Uncharacterized protein n=1 Tax=Albugo candida TaxID=65357 RepID=A0A024G8Y2_9STRA|nr:unnamed protein product [Albugo candida]|eukprot:CCI43129.1 unnamed protein product [Albugo candida]